MSCGWLDRNAQRREQATCLLRLDSSRFTLSTGLDRQLDSRISRREWWLAPTVPAPVSARLARPSVWNLGPVSRRRQDAERYQVAPGSTVTSDGGLRLRVEGN